MLCRSEPAPGSVMPMPAINSPLAKARQLRLLLRLGAVAFDVVSGDDVDLLAGVRQLASPAMHSSCAITASWAKPPPEPP